MKVEVDLRDDLLPAVDAEAERLDCGRGEVINNAVVRYFSEPVPFWTEADERKARAAIGLDDDLRQGIEEIAKRLGRSPEEVIERILVAYLTEDRRHQAAVRIWDAGPEADPERE